LRRRLELLSAAYPIERANANEFQFKTRFGDQARFHALMRADKEKLVATLAQHARHRERREHMPSGAAACEYKRRRHYCYGVFSLTLNNIPINSKVLSNELPPLLMNGNGIPLFGSRSSTTLMLIRACTITQTVTLSAR
jgi:hypothetical protein